MQHSKKRATGRPPAAGRERWRSPSRAEAYLRRAFEVWADVAVSDSNLEWRVPFRDIVRGIQTVSGIARLAGVDRSTVFRNRVKAGSFQALRYVLDPARKRKYPLVMQIGACAPLHPGAHKLALDLVIEWIRENALRTRRSNGAKYHPRGKVTVVEICERFGISRREFYRWKKSLLTEHRKQLEEDLLPRLHTRVCYPGEQDDYSRLATALRPENSQPSPALPHPPA